MSNFLSGWKGAIQAWGSHLILIDGGMSGGEPLLLKVGPVLVVILGVEISNLVIQGIVWTKAKVFTIGLT